MLEKMDKKPEKEFIEDLKEAIGLNNKSTTDWYDKNKFNKILTTIDSNNFNHKIKIGKFKFNYIDNLINNIKNNTISEADNKKKINELSEIKKAEIKGKRLINGQKILISLFEELLKSIFNNNDNNNNDNNNNNKDLSDNISKNESENISKSESENISKNESENISKSESENISKNESENNNNDDDEFYEIKQLNKYFKTIDQTKSLEEQLKLFKEKTIGANKINLKIFKTKAAYILKDLDEQLFEKIFGHEFVALADNKVINTISKKENEIIIDDIKKNTDKIFEQDEYSKFIIQPAYKRGDLIDTFKIILKFNEELLLDLT